jgi:hypothetical protein
MRYRMARLGVQVAEQGPAVEIHQEATGVSQTGQVGPVP